uniref:Uncharacterized protein n=1 Tax=uncultured marine virus TaxID=186617 RepID=A0A0F7L7K3_9VIRU|nr:hypothetical protein [uncultured marine virus]
MLMSSPLALLLMRSHSDEGCPPRISTASGVGGAWLARAIRASISAAMPRRTSLIPAASGTTLGSGTTRKPTSE